MFIIFVCLHSIVNTCLWGTYMKLVNKYQISAINSYWEKCDEKYLGRTEGRKDRRTEVKQYTTLRGAGVYRLSWSLYTLNIYAHFSSHFSQQLLMTRDLIFGHKLHIGTPYRGKRFRKISWTDGRTDKRTEVKQYNKLECKIRENIYWREKETQGNIICSYILTAWRKITKTEQTSQCELKSVSAWLQEIQINFK
jgi:hypothetical protein